MIKIMLGRFSQKLLLVLFIWGCIIVNVQAEVWMRAITGYPKYIASQWYTGVNSRDNAVREVCDQLEVYYGFSFRIWNGGNSPASCVGSNSTNSYSIGLGFRFRYTNDNPNSPPPLEVEKKYTIKLSPVTAQAYGNYLTAIEPNGITRSGVPENLINQVKLIAEVKDQDGNPVNAAIKLKVTALEGSGGHVQAYHTERNPYQAGKLKAGMLNSDTIDIPKSGMLNGIVEFKYVASAISGDHKIEATCTDITCNQIGQDSVWVGVQDLKLLPNSTLYQFIGDTDAHPDNHYISGLAAKKIDNIAFVYREEFPKDKVLHINDISLQRGGLFDISGKWKPSHKTHNKGTDIDIRANEFVGKTPGDIPKRNYKDFYRISKRHGCLAVREFADQPKEHFHLYCNEKYGKAE